ncbi:MAG TPA: geranylgeranyl reductase family protein [Aggregatilineales bacterium]|nr:geranylgeranyl reductase family protein [Aggregatilineales bacterium]
MDTQTLSPEILVVGAGPGGSATAWALAQAGHDVMMVDSASFPRDKTCGDGLTPLAVRTLREIGALARVEAAGAHRIDYTRISGPFGLSATMRFADYQPGYEYALVLPRLTFDDILRRYAVEGGVDFRGQVRVTDVERSGDRVTAVLATTPEGPLVIRPRHVVMAVGANMGLLSRTGFITHKPRFIRAARAYFENVDTALGEFYDFYFDLELLPGYGWVFPTGNGTANIGVGVLPVFWSTRRPARDLLDEFLKRRQAGGLAGLSRCGPVKGYPLRIDFPAQRAAGENWVVVGEAAGLVNPVTGEGIDLALESGLMAARCLHDDIAEGRTHHLNYQQELLRRYHSMFDGLRVLRDILITPLFTDYALLLMRQHHFLTKTIMKIAQGLAPPSSVLHPLFVAQVFLPITPRLLAGRQRRTP